MVLTGKTLLSLFPGIASGVVTGARGVFVCAWVCVYEECSTIELLLDLSAHCLQPVRACHINEVATNLFISSQHIMCASRCEKKTSLTESLIRGYNILSVVQSFLSVSV